MTEPRKERFRKLCKIFHEILDESQIKTLLQIEPNKEFIKIPLQKEKEMDEFIKVAKMYSQYRENPIICLGRSPKWFLNASLLMKGGIPDYKFVAFSGNWYRVYNGDFGDNRGLVRLDKFVPSKAEEKAYRKYLKNIQQTQNPLLKKQK